MRRRSIHAYIYIGGGGGGGGGDRQFVSENAISDHI